MGKEGMEWDKGGRENGKRGDEMGQGRKVEWEKRGWNGTREEGVPIILKSLRQSLTQKPSQQLYTFLQ